MTTFSRISWIAQPRRDGAPGFDTEGIRRALRSAKYNDSVATTVHRGARDPTKWISHIHMHQRGCARRIQESPWIADTHRPVCIALALEIRASARLDVPPNTNGPPDGGP